MNRDEALDIIDDYGWGYAILSGDLDEIEDYEIASKVHNARMLMEDIAAWTKG